MEALVKLILEHSNLLGKFFLSIEEVFTHLKYGYVVIFNNILKQFLQNKTLLFVLFMIFFGILIIIFLSKDRDKNK
jgi:hypothetical protein